MHLFSRTALYSLCTMLNCLGSAHLHVLHMIAYQSRARSASATRDVSETWRLDRKLAKTLCNCGGGLVYIQTEQGSIRIVFLIIANA
jgi:hypothetical protein